MFFDFFTTFHNLLPLCHIIILLNCFKYFYNRCFYVESSCIVLLVLFIKCNKITVFHFCISNLVIYLQFLLYRVTYIPYLAL